MTATANIYDLMQVDVPEGKSGNVSVSRFEITDHMVRMAMMRSSRMYTPAGTYTKLLRNGSLWMSDTHAERADHYKPVRQAQKLDHPGAVLITGLGLGMVINAMIQLPRVALIEVVEIDEDVIKLVGPHYQEKADRHGVRLNVVHGDAYDRKGLFPGQRHWDVVWHDIWEHLSADNLPEMTSLTRKYQHFADWQGCWGKEECRWARDRERRSGW